MVCLCTLKDIHECGVTEVNISAVEWPDFLNGVGTRVLCSITSAFRQPANTAFLVVPRPCNLTAGYDLKANAQAFQTKLLVLSSTY